MALPALDAFNPYKALQNRFVLQRNKVPLNADKPHLPGAHGDPENHLDLDTAYHLAKIHQCGIGYSAGETDVIVDFDNAIGPDGIKDWALGIISRIPPTLGEISPSGRGLHFYLRLSPDATEMVRHTVKTTVIEDGKVEFLRYGFYSTVTGEIHPNYRHDVHTLIGREAERLIERIRKVGADKPATATERHTNADLQRVCDADAAQVFVWQQDIISAKSFNEPTFNLIGWELWHKEAPEETQKKIEALYAQCTEKDSRWKERYKQIPSMIQRWIEFINKNEAKQRIRQDYTLQFTDLGCAWILEADNPNHISYVQGQGWAVWGGNCFDIVSNAVIQDKMFETISPKLKELAAAAPDKEAFKRVIGFANKSHSNTARANARQLIEGRLRTNSEDYDNRPALLNCRDIVVNLETNKTYEPSPDFMLTYRANYNPAAGPHPFYDKFRSEVFEGDQDVMHLYEVLKGLSICGLSVEQMCPILYGLGGNGKSTDMNVDKELFGISPYVSDNRARKYHHVLRPESLLSKNAPSDDKGNDLIEIGKARILVANETGEGNMRTERLKAIISGEEMQVRRNYGDFTTISLHCMLWIMTNHKPAIRGDDEAIWRRMLLFPFNADFTRNPDKALPMKLRSEMPQIMATRLRHANQYLREGLPAIPSKLLAVKAEWHRGADPLRQFVDEHIAKSPGKNVTNDEMYPTYTSWCARSGLQPMSKQKVGERMVNMGFERGIFRRGSATKRGFSNVALVGASDRKADYVDRDPIDDDDGCYND